MLYTGRAAWMLWICCTIFFGAQARLAALPCPASTSCPPLPAEQWEQSFTTYLWVPGQHGNVVVRGDASPVDVSISDTWSAITNDLSGAFTGHYEARKKRWTVLADLLYMKLEQEQSTPLGTAGVDTTQTIAELGGAYAASVSQSESCPGSFRTEIIGGVRYTDLSLKLTLPDATDEGSQSWLDPFIGLRYRRYLTNYWVFSVRGDVGGFEIGDASKLTLNGVLLFDYVSSPLWNIGTGWRWLDYDYATGSGASRFEYDVTLSGPFLDVTYNF